MLLDLGMRFLKTLAERLVPAAHTGRSRRRAVNVVLFGAVNMIGLCAAIYPIELLRPREWTVPLFILLMMMTLSAIVIVWARGPVVVAGNILCLSIFVGTVGFCLPFAGVAFPAACAMLLLPPAALALTTRRAALVWVITAMATLMAMAITPAYVQMDLPESLSGMRPLGDIDATTRWFYAFSMVSVILAEWMMFDLTELQRSEHEVALERANHELEAAREAAESSSRAKSAFLANISHEIRTPMNGMLGMSQMLLRASLGEEEREMVAVMHRSGMLLKAVINDVLDLSRIEAGRVDLESLPTDLLAVVSGVSELMEFGAREKGLSLVLDCPHNQPRLVMTDPVRLRQVLMNLVGNAVKFTHEGGVTIRVRTALDGGMIAVEIDVVDTGIGIARAESARLFEKFVQADASTTRKFGGTGLGLAICKDLVELMGGTIEVQSDLGKGSVFGIRMRLLAATERPLQAGDGTGADIVAPRRVLLVDDDPTNRFVVVKMLERLGARVSVAVSGADGVELARREAFDVILMDCQMPGMDGYEATALIRTEPRGREVPIIALTASAFMEDVQRCIDVGMNHHLSKPVNMDQLSRALERFAPSAQQVRVYDGSRGRSNLHG